MLRSAKSVLPRMTRRLSSDKEQLEETLGRRCGGQGGKFIWKDPPFLMGKLTISMVIFNSYVKLPEGNDLTATSPQ